MTPCTLAFQAPPSMGFSGQEYWSGLALPSPTEVARREQITFLEVLFCHLVLVIGLFDLEEET